MRARMILIVSGCAALAAFGSSPQQESSGSYEGTWSLDVDFPGYRTGGATTCRGRIFLTVRERQSLSGEWTRQASGEDSGQPFPCDHISGTLSGSMRVDGALSVQLFVVRRGTRTGDATFEYVPWLREFAERSNRGVVSDETWFGSLSGDRVTLSSRADAECDAQGEPVSVVYSLRFEGNREAQ